MRLPIKLIASLSILFILVGCNQKEMIKALTPPEDEQTAKGYIKLLQQKQFDQISEAMAPSIRSTDTRNTLEKMAGLFPAQEPLSTKVVGVNTFNSADSYKSNITFEYEFPNNTWLLINVAVEKKNNVPAITGFNVTSIPDSLEKINSFSLSNKTPFQYTALALAILIPLFSLYALVLCIRTKIEKRKWLWIIFTIFGFGQLNVNWSSGDWNVIPLSIHLFGSGISATPYGPWVISISLPIGAILFLIWRRKQIEGA